MGAMADMAIFMGLTCTFWVPVVTSISLTEKAEIPYCDIYNTLILKTFDKKADIPMR